MARTPGSTAPHERSIDLLLEGLGDIDPAVRASSLQALVRLRHPEVALQVIGSYVVRTLSEGGAATRDERKSCIECATRVHLDTVDEALISVASGADPELADMAVDALVHKRDARVVPLLLKRLRHAGDRDRLEIAELIARLDVRRHVDEIDELYSTLRAKWREEILFWLALALARAGRPKRMAELVAGLTKSETGRPPAIGPWLGSRLTAGGPLGKETIETILQAAGKTPRGQAAGVIEALEMLGGESAPAASPTASRGPAQTVRGATPARRRPRAARVAVRALPVMSRKGHIQVQVANAVGAVVGHPAMVSALFEHAAGLPEPLEVEAGNSIIEHIERQPGFVPDVPGLFQAYRLGVHPEQIAWTASRMPIDGVLDHLNEHLAAADPAVRVDAARFIAGVADQSGEPRGPRLALGRGAAGVSAIELEGAPPPAATLLDPPLSEPRPPPPPGGWLGQLGGPPIEQGRQQEWPRPRPAGRGSPHPAKPQQRGDRREVSSGFAALAAPDGHLRADHSLAVGSTYWYWFEIGDAPAPGRIEDSPSTVDVSKLPKEALLTVVVFPFASGLEVAGGSSGTLKLNRSGRISVDTQPGGAPRNGHRRGSRLLFGVRTPADPGIYGMRVSMYCKNILVQSRQVVVRVTPEEEAGERSLWATVDYTISGSLDFARVARRRGNQVSLMVNSQNGGGHGFLFAADSKNYYCPAWFSEHELDDYVLAVRQKLRKAAYGHEGAWVDGDTYKYESPTIEQLGEDLKALAIAGKRVHANIVARLACHSEGGADAADSLVRLMRTPGQIEIANRISPTLVLPAAVIYDQKLDDSIDPSRLTICKDFVAALEAKADLASHRCFNANCISQGDERVVCPGNFWGYRHSLGLPASVAPANDSASRGKASEAAALISYTSTPRFDIGFATGADLVLRDAHLEWIQDRLGVTTARAGNRKDAFSLFENSQPHVFYFYCHGGISQSMIPFLRVGADDDDPITPNNVTDHVRWPSTRPLVFINGCHTTALEPSQAIQFVTAFVENGHASGVIGTEITVFEPLATEFAQEFFRGVLLESMTVGEAVRAARLTLLAQKNPLGLAYVPFAAPDLEFKKTLAGTGTP